MVQHSIKNISITINALFFKLGTRYVHHKGIKGHPSCHHHDNQYAPGPVSIKTKIPRLYIKQGSSTPNKLMGRVKTTLESRVFQARPSHFKRLQMGIFVFYGETGAKSVAMVTT